MCTLYSTKGRFDSFCLLVHALLQPFLDFEQMTAAHSFDHHQGPQVPVWIFYTIRRQACEIQLHFHQQFQEFSVSVGVLSTPKQNPTLVRCFITKTRKAVYPQRNNGAHSRNHSSWKRNNAFPVYCCWPTGSCQPYKTVQCRHGNTTTRCFCTVVELQNISYCCKYTRPSVFTWSVWCLRF